MSSSDCGDNLNFFLLLFTIIFIYYIYSNIESQCFRDSLRVFLFKLECFLRNLICYIVSLIKDFVNWINTCKINIPTCNLGGNNNSNPDFNITINNCAPAESCTPSTEINDCEIIDSVVVNGLRYALTFTPGIIRIYNTNQSNVFRTINHNLGSLKSIRYINNVFVVQDKNSFEFKGVINNNSILFTPLM